MEAQLILENGTRFCGKLFGAEKNVVGELVFSTGMIGYQEALTDPSLAGQIVTMTFPLVGNYGINLDDMEAEHTSLTALVVREKCDYPSNFRYEMNLDDFLKEQGVVGIEGIDTRAVTKIIRDNGSMKACIMTGNPSDADVKALMNTLDNSHLVMDKTTEHIYTVNEAGTKHVAFIDMGTKNSMIESFVKRNCKVSVYPANIPASIIEESNPDLIFVSGGPGNPSDAQSTIETVKSLIGKYPVCGISLGHLIIGLALGCEIEKLPYGHHGCHPVKDLTTGKVYITSLGNDYIISYLSPDVEETFKNVNNGACEGIKHKSLPVMSVQFHPEGNPGPKETEWVFDSFLKEVK